MNATADRLEFAPPPTPGLARALLLAIVAHALLMVALTAGLSWRREAELVSAEAELWSAVPAQAAPKLIEPPPPLPTPPARVEPIAPPPRIPDADIAIEREKLRRQEDKERERKALEVQQRLAKLDLEKKREQDKRDREKKLAQDKRQAEQDAKRKETVAAQEAAKRLEIQRQENIKRLTGLANASGSSGATGTAAQSSGPSASYGAKLEARIRPNIVFSDETADNPRAVVLFNAAPDGTIMGKPRLKTSSGNKSWDEAVLRAVEKTESIPRDIDGRVPPLIEMGFTPKKQ
ncbi:MAG: cell envelope integrity protein TolA [Rhodoferax sp.]|nr:cell envelope integrity protein TolA [Rhodoferax sp.]